ncbi:hypothetical protein [Neobacillus sp. DY30]|uniref:hypothetical protein n=1 Tax=Neobacillus sp. DY30 TaxID=3047871 RepID=UPI0024BFF79E|nr:hypothetical protein [Neobacillus sp. DY30]WHY00398.1 hypothetical protein QNH29_28405 [Neobacillus sp. DY30]
MGNEVKNIEKVTEKSDEKRVEYQETINGDNKRVDIGFDRYVVSESLFPTIFAITNQNKTVAVAGFIPKLINRLISFILLYMYNETKEKYCQT